jgi:hypothetical protein
MHRIKQGSFFFLSHGRHLILLYSQNNQWFMRDQLGRAQRQVDSGPMPLYVLEEAKCFQLQ